MAKVLLVDTNFSSAPIYSELVRLGHETHVVGKNPNDCLAKGCPHYWSVDYADTDTLGRLIDAEGFDYLVPGCTDRSYTSCAELARGRFPGIPALDVDQAINNKARFRALSQQIGLPVPQAQNPDSGHLRWPLVVKPVDAFSGKGITVLPQEDPAALALAIDKARATSATGEALVEDFVAGQLHSHSAFIRRGKVFDDFIVEESCTANPFVVDTSYVKRDLPADTLATLRKAIESLANVLGLGDGLVHTQFILSGREVSLIEITRRCPGDLYSQLIELTTGYPYVSNYVRPFLGLEPIQPKESTYVPIMRHTVSVAAPQNFGHLHYKRPFHTLRWVPLSLVGDALKPSPASRIGILFALARSAPELAELVEITLKRELYDVDS